MNKIDRRHFIKSSAAAAAALAFSKISPAETCAKLSEPNLPKLAYEDTTAEILKTRGPRILTQTLYDFTYINNKFVEENKFFKMPRELTALPKFEDSKAILPSPFWDGHKSAIDCYWKVWEIAFRNLRQPTPESGFVANYIDTAFNDCIFMWDSAFILMFGRYGRRAFDFLRTFDNFYAKQHKDGFICREIGQKFGEDRFTRFDPTATGPNVMAWTEWEYFLNYGDKERLATVFPSLVAYHQWTRMYKTWPDGSYWNSGWGAGMDNQPRPEKQWLSWEHLHHGFMVWTDACFQGIISARLLMEMAKQLNRQNDVADIAEEYEKLKKYVNEKLWDDKNAYYFDLWRNGQLNGVKSIAAYWSLLAEVVPEGKLDAFLAHLENEKEFKRPHRVPTLSADNEFYDPNNGGYWKGAIWPPTNYMVLRGLTVYKKHDLAYDIAINHMENVWKVFEDTNSVWENYAPESAKQGAARKDFVGWGGLPPIATFFEYVLGVRPDVPNNKIIWDIRQIESHGIDNYPFANNGLLKLSCKARKSADEKPQVTVKSNVPVTLEIHYGKKTETLEVKPS